MPRCKRCSKEVYHSEEVSGAGSKWHPGCFNCATCHTALSSVNLRDNAGEIYCESCHGKQFGVKGYGFGGGGGVGLQSGKYDGAEPLHGTAAIDAEIQRKLNLKYDPQKEAKARAWLESFLGENFEEKTLQEALKSGVRLITAGNKGLGLKIQMQIGKGNSAPIHRENIAKYIKACALASFVKANQFETADLYDGRDMVKVIENIFELQRRVERKSQGEGHPSSPSRSHEGDHAEAAPVAAAEAAAAPAEAPAAAPAAAAAPVAAAPAAAAPAASASSGETCPDCAAPRGEDSSFCPDCGHKFSDGESAAF